MSTCSGRATPGARPRNDALVDVDRFLRATAPSESAGMNENAFLKMSMPIVIANDVGEGVGPAEIVFGID